VSGRPFRPGQEKRNGSWYYVAQGTPEQVIDRIASDAKGTFHGLGALDAILRRSGGSQNRLQVQMLDDFRFVYVSTGEVCTTQEALFHFFGIPVDVIAEPRQWYIYHRQPQIVEVSQDRTRILVEFTAYGMFGPISGTCLYVIVDDEWSAFTIKPNQSGDIATAITWLEKRQWREW
jgi:hypothetical protein